MNQHHTGTGHNYNANRDVNILVAPKHISLLSTIINILGKRLYNDVGNNDEEYKPFDIDEKIVYNDVKVYKQIINEYKIYVGKLSVIYKELDKGGTNTTHITLSNIKTHYLKVKMKYLSENKYENELIIVKNNADAIISEVEERLMDEINKSSNIAETIECINVSLQIIMIDALMRCKILEKPE